VKDASAAKFFLSYDYPWWRRSLVYADFGVSDTVDNAEKLATWGK
jgi:hypothetical protein